MILRVCKVTYCKKGSLYQEHWNSYTDLTDLTRECSLDAEVLRNVKYLPPGALRRLLEEGLLYVDGELHFYQRRYNTLDVESSV